MTDKTHRRLARVSESCATLPQGGCMNLEEAMLVTAV
jgi:hypothetical protein